MTREIILRQLAINALYWSHTSHDVILLCNYFTLRSETRRDNDTWHKWQLHAVLSGGEGCVTALSSAPFCSYSLVCIAPNERTCYFIYRRRRLTGSQPEPSNPISPRDVRSRAKIHFTKVFLLHLCDSLLTPDWCEPLIYKAKIVRHPL